jgi:RNA polymerase sigma-70 factor, ECF subfamily
VSRKGFVAGLTEQEFAAEFTAAFRSLWLTAFSVVRDSAWAEDVVQDAAVVGLRKRAQYEPGTSFRAWMGQIVRFVALNKARKLSKAELTQLETGLLDAASARANETPPTRKTRTVLTASGQLPAHQEHFDDELTNSLDGLSRMARACLLLRTIEGLSYDEISQVLGVPKGTAMSHVHRSRNQLRDVLNGIAGAQC